MTIRDVLLPASDIEVMPAPYICLRFKTIKTLIMNTQNYYPEKTSMAKAILVAGLVLIQVTLFAGENTGKYTLEDTTESEIELEDWMSNTQSCFWYDLADAKESELAIEDWMSNVQSNFWYDLTDAKESEPAIEDWMCNTDDSFWFDLSNAKESELAIEDWMGNVQNNFWYDLKDVKEPELAIENWMTNPDEWTSTGSEVMLSSL